MYPSPIYKQILLLPPPTPHRTSPEIANHTLVCSHRTIRPRARSAVVWAAPGRAPSLSDIMARGRLELLWEQFGLGWFYLVSVFILLDQHSPYPFWPPSLLNMYNNYTETATNLYIVFGSNSMRRWGILNALKIPKVQRESGNTTLFQKSFLKTSYFVLVYSRFTMLC